MYFSQNSIQVISDPDNYRLVVKPLWPGNQMDVPTVFRAWKKNQKPIRWAEIAEFSGLKNANQAFRITYLGNKPSKELTALNKFLVIDALNQCAYFYDHEHRPEAVPVPHVGPTIANTTTGTMNATTLVPVKVTTRITVADILDRRLTMTLTPSKGYLLGINDINLCEPNAPYQVSGTVRTLNNILKSVYFVGTEAGAGTVTIAVNDNAGVINSTTSTVVNLAIVEGAVESIPVINLPTNQTVGLNVLSTIDPITVSDEDDKILEVRLTPFGCTLTNFKNFLGTIRPGEMRVITGRQASINADIANMKVIPTSERVAIGVQLFCNRTQLNQYLYLNVMTGETTGDTLVSAQAEAPVVEETVEVAKPTYTVTFKVNGGSGTVPSKMTATDDSNYEITLPECTLTAPAGKEFMCWSNKSTTVGTIVGVAGEKVTISANTVMYALWVDQEVEVTETSTTETSSEK